jgi:4-amino-4-deoxy-L-arabinose transferase-like glycosyltransferase
MGDHEALVAECARNMRLSGDWVVPTFLDTPYFRKPPLPYWLIAAASYLFPNDPRTHLPVTTAAARLPSALAALATVLMLWRLGASMFGRRVGIVTAVISSSSLLFLLYAPNATAEMLLTMCCTWSYLHFWYAVTARRRGMQFLHMMLFYVAMGFGMLAKGPAPIAVVAIPLALWWYTERPLRLLAHNGLSGWRQVLMCFLRGLWPRTIQAFTKLWLVPGLFVFASIFVPWMWMVASRHPHAWNLWNWQYWQRVQGNYEDTRERGIFYYVPMVAGMAVPWVFLAVEGAASPWLRRYARHRRALLYAGLWVLTGTVVMSLMEFKKPYYIAPAVPGLLLLMAVVADRFYTWVPHGGPMPLPFGVGSRRFDLVIPNARQFAWIVWGIAFVGLIAGVIAGGVWLKKNLPGVSVGLTLMSAGVVAIFLLAGVVHIRGRGWIALGITAVTTLVTFNTVWYWCAPAFEAIDNLDKSAELAKALDDAGVGPGIKVLWTGTSPDSRLKFYFNRRNGWLVTPEEIVNRIVDRIRNRKQLEQLVLKRTDEALASPEPVYLIVEQKHQYFLEQYVSRPVHILGTVENPRSPGKGRVIISNIPRARR